MGEMIRLEAADGHVLDAWLAEPPAQPAGGVVMVQEIFGLTDQMRRTADRFAARGYRVVVPAMFDRVERGLTVSYDDIPAGLKAMGAIPEAAVMADVAAARDCASAAGGAAIVGYCWGGNVAYRGASLQPFDCAVSWYGGGIDGLVERMRPRVPVQYHFGGRDAHIPPPAIEAIRAADPGGEFHLYPEADHGFCCDDRASFDPEAARVSEERALTFLASHLSPSGR